MIAQSGLVRFLIVSVCACIAVVSGCGELQLTMEDVAYVPGEKSIFVGQLERDSPFGIPDAMENESISFWVGDDLIGVAKTDDEGRARLAADLGKRSLQDKVKARAWVGLRRVEVVRPIQSWDANTVIIAVDVDHTIAETDYEGVLLDDVDTKTTTIPGSVEALNALSRKFHVMYVTARPNFLYDETRQWLKMHGYPQAPLVMGPNASALVDQAELKEDLLKWRREPLPNLLIGIGDKASDAEAYHAVGMLSILLAPAEEELEAENVFVMPNWAAIQAFFDVNGESLTKPDRLADILERDAITELDIPDQPEHLQIRIASENGDDADDDEKDNDEKDDD